jgi:dipeptidyl aminopeptidase/acylaminoacyl peptidase
MGSKDEIFQISHLLAFHDALQNEGVKCEKVVVEGAGHAFDMWSEIGSEVHENVIKPAVEWVSAVTGLRTVVRPE